MVALMLRGCIKPDVNRDALDRKIIPRLLLIRRIVMFLLSRFKHTPQPDVTYLDGLDPENVVKILCGRLSSCHRAYPVGLSMSAVVVR